MKLLFIENRYKTYFFEAVANRLISEGHEIDWIIQNKEFTPKGKWNNHIIEYPTSKNYKFSKDDAVEDIIKSDRQLNFFNKKSSSYFYYYNDKINELIKKINPDLVFGEATAFHELLAISNCKKLDIMYLNPSTCRYPMGRFSFYKYDTLKPFKGSGELLSNEEAQTVIDQIVYRKAMPDYMKPSPMSNNKKAKDKIKKVLAYVKGERFNTPHPLVKFKLESLKENNIIEWDKSAENAIKETQEFKVLYPMQMQPEANIDVWGKKYRDQPELIATLAKHLPKNTLLYVKPNPKSKYELSKKLIDVVANNDNVISLKHEVKMDNVLPLMDLVITVTGTIAIECVLSNKPVINLVKTINHEAKNCIFIESINSNLEHIINKVKNNNFITISNQEKIDFINTINTTSYKGVISDPFSDKNSISEKNIGIIVKAFNNIFN